MRARSAAVQSAAGVLHGAKRDPRLAAGAALPQSGGAAGGADEEPHRRPADGDGDALQQGAAAWQSVLQRVVREFAGGASLGGGTAQAEPGTVGVLRDDPAAAAEGAVRASGPQRACGAITDHPRGGRDHGPWNVATSL